MSRPDVFADALPSCLRTPVFASAFRANLNANQTDKNVCIFTSTATSSEARNVRWQRARESGVSVNVPFSMAGCVGLPYVFMFYGNYCIIPTNYTQWSYQWSFTNCSGHPIKSHTHSSRHRHVDLISLCVVLARNNKKQERRLCNVTEQHLLLRTRLSESAINTKHKQRYTPPRICVVGCKAVQIGPAYGEHSLTSPSKPCLCILHCLQNSLPAEVVVGVVVVVVVLHVI